MKDKQYLLLLTALLSLISAVGANELEQVVVTAARTPVAVDEIGSSFTILTREELQDRQTASLSAILREVPGFAVSRSGVLGSNTQIRVRGAEANHVLVLVDGIEVNDPAQGGEFDFAHVLTSEIERVEIVRGPQSALWGSDALSGVINILTAAGDAPLRISAFAEGGSFATWRGGGSLSRRRPWYHFNLAGSYIDTKGENISRRGDEKDGYQNATVTFAGAFTPHDDMAVNINLRHTQARNEFDDIDFFVTGLPADSDNVTETTQEYGRVSGRLSLLDQRWGHQLALAVTSTDNDNFVSNLETTSTQGRKYKFEYQTSIHLDSRRFLDAAHTVTLALEHESEQFTQRGPASFFGDPNQDQEIETDAWVVEYRLSVFDQLHLSTGVRHDDNSAFDDVTTYRVTAAYRLPVNGTRLRGAYGTGVKNPTFTERFGFFATSLTPFIGNADLKPEKSHGWELGIDQSLLDDRVRFAATYFNERLRDEINGFVFDPSTSAFTAVNVSGRSKRDGVELAGTVTFNDRFRISGAYTYLDATEPDLTGTQIRELRRPKHSGNINVSYSLLRDRGNLNLNVGYSGEQRDVFFPPFPNPRQTVTLDAFTLVTVSGSYRISDQIQVYARVENLLDEDYEEVFGFQTPGIGAYTGVRFVIAP